ncbi:MAG: phosphatidate cytidylyltransferase [Rickettsiales bacterium]|nr:phosphatidate cytidylyltransferase [Rickettsiales bacterium]MDA9573540.1 phosphatidate cytidylyltransferase [Rickettsiales bacterium]
MFKNIIIEIEDMVKDNIMINLIKKFKIFIIDKNNSNLRNRIISSLILIPVAIYAIFFSMSLFILISLILVFLMTIEWGNITQSASKKTNWQIFGFIYIILPIYCAIKLRQIDPFILLWMFFIIWTTDIFAYFFGKFLKGPKLAPKISPNKTWSGLLGGVISCAVVGVISSFIFPGTLLFFITISILLSIIEQFGDLFESKIKRIFNVKDSGAIIPGHGGVIDRMDGMVFVAPITYALVILMPGNFIL